MTDDMTVGAAFAPAWTLANAASPTTLGATLAATFMFMCCLANAACH